jgi:hypothetical protein
VKEETQGSIYIVTFTITALVPIKEFYGDLSSLATSNPNLKSDSPRGSTVIDPTISITEEPEWKQKWRKAQRSMLVRVHNNSSRALIRRDYRLPSGQWLNIPSERIEPNSIHEFATQNREGLLTGTEGQVFYWIDGEKGDIKLEWTNPGIGSASCSFHCASAGQVVEKSLRSGGKNPEAIFYIHDTDDNVVANAISLTSSKTNPTSPTTQSNDTKLSTSKPSAPPSIPIRLLTLNTNLVLSLFGGKETINRANSLAQFLLNHKENVKLTEDIKSNPLTIACGLDILVLQEVIHEKARVKLVSALHKDYPYIVSRYSLDINPKTPLSILVVKRRC